MHIPYMNIFGYKRIKAQSFSLKMYSVVYKPHRAAFNLLKSQATGVDYNISYKVINAANYGVPQIRERFICVGVKKWFCICFPPETHYNQINVPRKI